jgi:hypothetical protein
MHVAGESAGGWVEFVQPAFIRAVFTIRDGVIEIAARAYPLGTLPVFVKRPYLVIA